MFQNLTKVVTASTKTITNMLDIIDINTNSVKTLSKAGNARADFVLKSAEHDIAMQSIELDAKIAKLQAKVSPKD